MLSTQVRGQDYQLFGLLRALKREATDGAIRHEEPDGFTRKVFAHGREAEMVVTLAAGPDRTGQWWLLSRDNLSSSVPAFRRLTMGALTDLMNRKAIQKGDVR